MMLLQQLFLLILTSHLSTTTTTCSTQGRIIAEVLKKVPLGCPYFCIGGCSYTLINSLIDHPGTSYSFLSSDKDINDLNNLFQTKQFCLAIIIHTKLTESEINMTMIEDALFKASLPLLLFSSGDSKQHANSLLANIPKLVVQEINDEDSSVIASYQNLVKTVNYWSPKKGFTREGIGEQLAMQSGKHSLQGQNLTVSVVGFEPYVTYRDNKIGGVDARLLAILASTLNFTYYFKKEDTYMYLNQSTHELSGTIGSVYNKISQLGIGDISIIYNRYQLIDYTTSLYTFTSSITSRKPERVPPFSNWFKPFEFLPWILLLLGLALSTAIFIANALVQREQKHFWEVSIAAYSILIRQITRDSLLRKNITSKILCFVWILGASFLSTLYLSDLRSYLMIVDYERTIDTIQDVLDLQRTLYIPAGTAIELEFASSTRPDIKKAWQQAHNARGGKYAVIDGWMPESIEKDIIYGGATLLLIDTEIITRYSINMKKYGWNPLTIGKEKILSFHTGFVMQKYTPWKGEFDRILGRLRDMGIVNKFTTDAIDPKAVADLMQQNKKQELVKIFRKFALEDEATIFLALLAGLFFAMLVLVIEVGLPVSFFKKCSDIRVIIL